MHPRKRTRLSHFSPRTYWNIILLFTNIEDNDATSCTSTWMSIIIFTRQNTSTTCCINFFCYFFLLFNTINVFKPTLHINCFIVKLYLWNLKLQFILLWTCQQITKRVITIYCLSQCVKYCVNMFVLNNIHLYLYVNISLELSVFSSVTHAHVHFISIA